MNENASIYFIDRHKNSDVSGKTAFVECGDEERSITYLELANKTSQMIDFYNTHQIYQEDRIAMLMFDVIEFPVIFWGSLKSGVVPIPINTLLSHEIIETILNDSRAKAIFISYDLLDQLSEVLKKNEYIKHIFVIGKKEHSFVDFSEQLERSKILEPKNISKDEVAFWLYSSGSTGKPKGVKHVHSSLKKTFDTYANQVLGIKNTDIVFSVAKLFFAYGLGNAMTFPMSVGATTILLPTRPVPEKVSEILKKYKITILFAVPTIFSSLLEFFNGNWNEGYINLRVSVSAGEALPKNIGEQWKLLTSTEILDGIGSTEMLHIFLSNFPGDIEYGTTGIAVPGYELKLVDENNNEVGADTIGELLVKGETSADGYWNMRDKSRKTFEGEWTRTGDKYIKQKNGKYIYCGRTDDMFKVSGIWVSPFEVEQAISSHPEILESAVVPEMDKEGLVKSKAFVVLKNQKIDENQFENLKKEIKDFVKEKIGMWKYPRNIVISDELPKTATGKIQRFKLRS